MRIALALAVGLTSVGMLRAEPTFNRDVAPILFRNCAVCHRPGQIGPFPLLTYRDARKRAALIVRVTGNGFMPPWKPRAGHGDFADVKRLTEEQIDTLRRWFEAGCPEGNAADLPAAPKFKDGWQLGKPDVILKMPKPFTIPAEGKDIYVHFVFPLKFGKDVYVRGFECRPSNPRVAHHAVGIVDSTGTARRLNEQAGGNGYRNFGGPGFVPEVLMPAYVPGQTPRFFAPRAALTIPKGTDFVLEMHYHSVGKEETDRTEVGLYLTRTAPTRSMLGVMMSSAEIDIAPGDAAYTVSDSFVLPVDLLADSIWAHMHLIGKEVKIWAELPGGRVERLLWIDDWDFNWQDTYRFRRPLPLPRGTIVRAEWRFDNSGKNPRNPHTPPRRVRHGEGSDDEMSTLWLNGEVASGVDLQVLLRANLEHAFELIRKAKDFKAARRVE